ncbi:MAG: ATP-dependent DNA ligase [Thermoproteota archaeon]|nr:MAG: ATP-dependent DNA ligase [Candidatus Korarchaeota archaeon]
MKFSVVAEYYSKLEKTTKRLEMTALLTDLFLKTPPSELPKVVYLTQGKLYPDFVGVEIGVAEKLYLRALSLASGVSVKELDEQLKQAGDVGVLTERVLSKKPSSSLAAFMGLAEEELTVSEVYGTLDKIAKVSGEGAQETKIRYIAGLLKKASPLEGRYIARIILGKLRLGIADMTILDALAEAFAGGRENRPILEHAYNISSDLGLIAEVVAERGVEGLKGIKPKVGVPIRPMLAERLPTAEEILERMGGKCIAEYKYDGERMQIHKSGDRVVIFSRRLENITHHYPDVVEMSRRHIKAREAIVDGECVAINLDTGEMLPFQELMHRRGKYGIEKAMEEYPTAVFLFDCLYVDGRSLLNLPLLERRRALKEIVDESDRFRLSEHIIASSIEELEEMFERAIADGCEGLIAKSIAEESVYQAGARGFLWIKWKRSYQSKMVEPVDLVIVGAFMGRGKRAGTYGALLLAAYDSEKDQFVTVAKCGTGFTDEELFSLPKVLEPYKRDSKHPRVYSKLEADVWFTPAKVIEVIGDEITLSPVHTCGLDVVRRGAGLAIRFPRFTGRWREDKGPEDATTVKEIVEMYRSQLKKVTE